MHQKITEDTGVIETAEELLAKTGRVLEQDLCRIIVDTTGEINFEIDHHKLTHDPEPLDITRLQARAAYAKRLLFDLWRGEPVLDVLCASINIPRLKC